MLRFKDLIERVNETRSFYLEEDKKLIKAKDNGSYPAHHDHITHDTYGDAGDEATSAHHKFASERAPVHTFKHLGSTHKIYHHPNGSTIHTMEHTHGHHGDDIAVYSGHHDPKHIENQEKKHSNMNEEVEELDEDSYNDEHAAHSKAKSLHTTGHLKPEYHKDGSATIHVKPYNDTSSTRITDGVHQDAGLYHNHPSKKIAKGITQIHHGLKYSTRSDDGGKTHAIHISPTTEKHMRDGSARQVREEVEGLDEISAMKAIRTSVKREVSGVNKSLETGDYDDAAQKKIDKNKERIHKKYGYRAANIAHKAAGKKLDYDDGPYQPRKRKYMEEVDLDESRMKDLAMDMESLSHADFKKKHRRSKQQMQDALKSEELKGNQHKIDANKNGKVDGHDFKILRNAKKARYQ